MSQTIIDMRDLDEACERELVEYQQHKRSKRRRRGNDPLDATERQLLRQSESKRRERGYGKLVQRLRTILEPLGPHKITCCPRGEFFYIDLALVHIEFANRNFTGVMSLIKDMISPEFPRKFYLEVEYFWYQAVYETVNLHKDRQMNPVNRYRIRKRNPCPTAEIVGPRKYKITADDKRVFEECYASNTKPDRNTKEILAGKTGQPVETVSNWFKNKRQRSKYKARRAHNTEVKLELDSCECQQEHLINVSVALKESEHDPMVADLGVVSSEANNEYSQHQQIQYQECWDPTSFSFYPWNCPGFMYETSQYFHREQSQRPVSWVDHEQPVLDNYCQVVATNPFDMDDPYIASMSASGTMISI